MVKVLFEKNEGEEEFEFVETGGVNIITGISSPLG